MRIKLIYGTDTGNTEAVIDNILLSELENRGFEVEAIAINHTKPEIWDHNNLSFC